MRTLRELWDERASDDHIASVLGRTPRGVLCKRHRIGLRKYHRATRPPKSAPVDARIEALRESLEAIRVLARSRGDHVEIQRTALEALEHDERRAAG